MVQNYLNMQFYTEEWLLRHSPDVYMPMLYTADNVAKKYNISRESQDRVRAAEPAAHRRGAEGRPVRRRDRRPRKLEVRARQRPGKVSEEHVVLTKDEGNRPDTTLEGLAQLKGAVPGIKDTTITAGNSSQLS